MKKKQHLKRQRVNVNMTKLKEHRCQINQLTKLSCIATWLILGKCEKTERRWTQNTDIFSTFWQDNLKILKFEKTKTDANLALNSWQENCSKLSFKTFFLLKTDANHQLVSQWTTSLLERKKRSKLSLKTFFYIENWWIENWRKTCLCMNRKNL